MTAMASQRLALTLDELASLPGRELQALFLSGRVPSSLAALNGAARGRVLQLRHLDHSVLRALLRPLFASRHFPWQGKRFDTRARRSGKGDNCLRLPFVELRWFPFRARVGKSHIDGQDCVLLDYDSASNPRPVRRIRDELREVSPGVYLGPVLWQRRGALPALLLWFALDTRISR